MVHRNRYGEVEDKRPEGPDVVEGKSKFSDSTQSNVNPNAEKTQTEDQSQGGSKKKKPTGRQRLAAGLMIGGAALTTLGTGVALVKSAKNRFGREKDKTFEGVKEGDLIPPTFDMGTPEAVNEGEPKPKVEEIKIERNEHGEVELDSDPPSLSARTGHDKTYSPPKNLER